MASVHRTGEEVEGILPFTIDDSQFTTRQHELPHLIACRLHGEEFCNAALAELIRSPSVHSHTLDALDANKLDADIIAAIPLIGKRYQLVGGIVQIPMLGNNPRHVRRLQRTMQSIAAEQQHITGDHLCLIDVDIDEEIVSHRAEQPMAIG